jgi:hypothetical protein
MLLFLPVSRFSVIMSNLHSLLCHSVLSMETELYGLLCLINSATMETELYGLLCLINSATMETELCDFVCQILDLLCFWP